MFLIIRIIQQNIIINVQKSSYKVSVVYVYGSVHRESMSVIAQQDATIYSLLYFCKTALHVSGDTSTHHQEHM